MNRPLLLLVFVIASCTNAPTRQQYTGAALGTTYSIIAYADEDLELDQSLSELFDRLNQSMSTYHPQSDISRINRGERVQVDSLFRFMFEKSAQINRLTSGYFDPTVGILVDAWGFGAESLNAFNAVQVDSLLEFVGFSKLSLTDTNELVKAYPGIRIDFNAIAKGYSVDLIKELFEENLLENFLIEVGGELTSRGYAENNRRWKVAIQNPIETNSLHNEIFLTDKSLATSGNYRKFRIDPITGERYVHIINPLTGSPLSNNILSASVISDNCIEADAWATSLMVMNPINALDIINEIDGIEILLLTSKNDEIFEIKSNGWDLVTQ